MADLVLLTPRTPADAAVAQVAPGLVLLPHRVTVLGMDVGALVSRPGREPALVVVDAVTDLVAAHGVLRTLAALELASPVLAVVADAALGLLDDSWPLDDLVLTGAGPAEVAARVRLLLARRHTLPPTGDGGRTRAWEHDAGAGPHGGPPSADEPQAIRVADVVVDEASWTVRAGGQVLDLTYKEFELLRYLVRRPGRVVTRDTLLQEVWGMDYYGGTRTVDVHIRRLRAKLGPERESLIGTIRGVGYRFSGPHGGEDG
ncbi:winged-helix domain-containing protein [uncultured Ornithinimicrobium sp.]|uniref:winged helix-turn-helix transcriptional regulator n=1 Tax=uncultured Ornithinimicrobium sp. TaxID=259307 RepID=UPI002597D387|nr:winged-helix domain-containing protein [uncultured Ornithinimicrobium sp.]